MVDNDVGEVSANVELDFSGLEEKLRAQLARLAAKSTLDVKVDGNTTRLDSTLAKFRRRLVGRAVEIEFRADRTSLAGVERVFDGFTRRLRTRGRSGILNAITGLISISLIFFGTLAIEGVRVFSTIGRAAGSMFTAMIDGFRAAQEAGAGFFRAGIDGFRNMGNLAAATIVSTLEGGTAFLAAAVAVAAGVTVMSIALGPLIALLSILLGVIGAIVATLAGALVGAIGLAVGALVPLVAGLGLAVGAFFALDEAAKKSLKEAFSPLLVTLKELGALAASNIFDPLKTQVEGLNAVLQSFGIRHFVEEISVAVGDFGLRLAEAFQTDKFEEFFEVLGNTLPTMMTLLGDAFINFGAGMGGVFLALQQPLIDMAIWLDTIAIKFNEWANSAAGQTALTDFFQKAQEALSAIGGLVWAIGEALIALFNGPAGDVGIKVFEKMRKKVEEWVEYLTDPKNKKEIEAFFNDVERIGGKIVRVIDRIIEGFKKWNTPEHRADLEKIVDIADRIAAGFEAVSSALSKISLSKLTKVVEAIPVIGPILGGLDAFFADGVRNFAGGLAVVGERGPEIVRLPRGSDVYSNEESRAMVANSGSPEAAAGNFTYAPRFYGAMTSAETLDRAAWAFRFAPQIGLTAAEVTT